MNIRKRRINYGIMIGLIILVIFVILLLIYFLIDSPVSPISMI